MDVGARRIGRRSRRGPWSHPARRASRADRHGGVAAGWHEADDPTMDRRAQRTAARRSRSISARAGCGRRSWTARVASWPGPRRGRRSRPGRRACVATSISMLRRVRDEAPAAVRDGDRRRRDRGAGAAGSGSRDARRAAEPAAGRSRGAALAGPIGAALALPAALERDTHVAALAEWEFGAARGLTDFLYVTVSTGIGGAIVVRRAADRAAPTASPASWATCSSRSTDRRAAAAAAATSRRSPRAAGSPGAAGSSIAAGRGGRARRRSPRRCGRGLDARDVAEAEDEGDADAAEIMERARRAFAESCVDARRRLQPAADRRRRQRRPEPGRAMAGAGPGAGRGGRVLRAAGQGRDRAGRAG